MQAPSSSAYINLNLSLLFIATSGVLGKWIPLAPELSIFWRSFIAIPFLVLFLWGTKQSIRISFRWNIKLVCAGVLMGLHWVTYFYSLQWSNMAVGMLSLFTFPVITACLEPLFFRTPFQKSHLALGGLTLVGIYFLVPSATLFEGHGKAVAAGLFSALCYALRNLLLKQSMHRANGSQLMLSQVVIIALCFAPFVSLENINQSLSVGWALLFLALFTTVIGHSLFLYSLKHFSVTTASLVACVQPLYGIALAYFVLGEVPHWGIWVGGSLILLAVFVEARTLKVS